jgi:tetratricopeptide (TPR) repeat protein
MALSPEHSTPAPAAALSAASTASRPHRSRRLLVEGVFFLAVFGAAAWAADRWLLRKGSKPAGDTGAPPPDPRLTYTGPYRNIHPDVKYVGDAACAGCHKTETDGFHRHPMGRSIVPISQLVSSKLYEKPPPFEALDSVFVMERRGNRVFNVQRRFGPGGELLGEVEAEVHYAIGSGSRGHSYMTVQHGAVFQTSISWYSQNKKWDLSPGFQKGSLRDIVPECLFCHAGGVRPVEGRGNRYEEPVFRPAAIGCERCHGPGEVHVQARKADERVKGRIDFTIVNPKHLSPELRENVCQQCHLEGAARVLRRGRGLFDYRPGLPLDQFVAVFVAVEEDPGHRRAVSQVEQMYASKCFRASKGKLGCATCHDPHDALPGPSERVAFHRRKCLSCHEREHRCSLDLAARLAQSKEDSCIGCHMPRLSSTDIAHTATTDHTIPRKPGAPARDEPKHEASQSGCPLTPFCGQPRLDDPEFCRDLGIGLVRAAQRQEGVRPQHLPLALDLLERAAQSFPGDMPLLLTLSECLERTGKAEQALAVAEQALAQWPRHEQALRRAAQLSLSLKQNENAASYYRRVLALNPRGSLNDYFYLATAEVGRGNWRGALDACNKALTLDSTLVPPRVLRACCYVRLGDARLAEEEIAKVRHVKDLESEPFFQLFQRIKER